MNAKMISVVSGTYNRLAYLQQMVLSVRSSIGVGIPYEIVLVDGGSTDGSIEWMKQQEDIVLIEQGELLGIVAAFSAGFAKAVGRYVVIANDDIEFRYESLQNAFSYMEDNPDCGMGCFHQNRYSEEYTVQKMFANDNGRRVMVPYGQVCIVPKWLGDHVNWWGDYLMNYGGDNELTCNIYELGYKVTPLEYCCINDFKVEDALRASNNIERGSGRKNPDARLWANKWRRGKIVGPILKPRPVINNPIKRMDRILFAPLYHRNFPIQHKTKHSMRDALAKKYIVSEVDYRQDLEQVYHTIKMFDPDIVFIQYHSPKEFSYNFMLRLKEEFPNKLYVYWNGDYRESVQLSSGYMEVSKLFDLACHVTVEISQEYALKGINYRYLQSAYETYPPVTSSEITPGRYDVCFLGNCNDQQRVRMGEILRFHKEWKTGLYGQWPGHIKSDGNNHYDFRGGEIIYRSSKMAISDNLFPKSIGYVSNRLFQALHAGVFVLQQKIPGMEEILGLQDGVHLVVWEDLFDLETKITEWRSKDLERSKIASDGKRFVDSNHSFDVRVAELQSLIAEYRNQK